MKTFLSIASISLGSVLVAVATVYGVSALRVTQEVEAFSDLSEVFPDETTRPSPLPASEGSSAPLNILVLGFDGSGASGRDFDSIRGRRSDAMMLVNVSGDRSAVTVVSLMRDLWVDIPGHRTDKLNAALSIGGVPMAVAAVEQLLDVRVDHVVMTDFDGLIGVADFVGGVDINNPVAFRSTHLVGKFFEAGPQKMSGEELLAFSRERYAFQDGDYRRVRNQRLALQALAKQLGAQVNPLAPWEIPGLVRRVGQFIAIDSTLTPSTLARLAVELRSSAVATATLPTLGTGASPGGQSIVIPNYDGISQVSEALKADTLYKAVIFIDER